MPTDGITSNDSRLFKEEEIELVFIFILKEAHHLLFVDLNRTLEKILEILMPIMQN